MTEIIEDREVSAVIDPGDMVSRADPAYTGGDDYWTEGWGPGSRTSAGTFVGPRTSIQAVAVMACMTMIAEDVGKLRPYLFKQEYDKSETVVTKHPLVKLFQYPTGKLSEGGWQTWQEFCTQMTSALVLRGNAYAAVVRDTRGNPFRLVALNPDSVFLWESPADPESNEPSKLFWLVTRVGLHMLSVLKGLPLLIPFEDVLHLRSGISANGLLGDSRMSMGRNAIGLALAQEETASRWTGSGGRLSGTLSTESTLDKNELKRVAESWKQAYVGLQNTGKIAVLQQGLTFKPLQMNSVDLQFIESRKFQINEIGRLFRVPVHMLGIEDASRLSVEQHATEYVRYTLLTITETWKQKLEFMFELSDEDIQVGFNFDEFLKTDTAARFAMYRIGIMGSVLTPNEARAQEKLPPKPGGDELLFPSNTTPFGSDHSGNAPDGAGKPAGSEGGAGNPVGEN